MTVFSDTLKAHPDLAYAVGMTVAQAADSEPQAAPEPQAKDAPEGEQE